MSRLRIPAMALEPSLWGSLPRELLHLVFARLPVAGVGQLRVLSKEWKRNVDYKNSEFNQVFDATAHLNMFALLSSTYESKFGNIYDVQADQWHVCETDAVLAHGGTSADVADGGLECCVSYRMWHINKLVFFTVMNPLTKQKTQLPPLLCMGVENTNTLIPVLRIVKLTMDKKTKEYKVFVVRSIAKGNRGFFAQVYDSHTKEWMVVEATQGRIIGWDNFDMDCNLAQTPILCMYNCADGTLQQFKGTEIAPELEDFVDPTCCVLLEDHLFVLHKEASPGPANLLEAGARVMQKCCISEFHLPEKSTAWVNLEVRGCGPCKFFRDSLNSISHLRLYGCNRVLLINDYVTECAWLYNLSTCEWRKLPAFEKPFYIRVMIEISWSAVA